MNLKLSPRDELIVTIVGLVVVVALLVVFLVMPKFRERGQLVAEQESIRQEVLSNQAKLAQLKDAQRESVATRAALIRVSNEMPSQPQLPTLIVDIQDLANQSGIDFVSVTPKEPEKTGQWLTIEMGMSLKGQFRDLVDFLTRLSALQRKVRVARVTVGVDEYPNLNMDVTGETYVMSESTGGGQVPPPPPASGGGGP